VYADKDVEWAVDETRGMVSGPKHVLVGVGVGAEASVSCGFLCQLVLQRCAVLGLGSVFVGDPRLAAPLVAARDVVLSSGESVRFVAFVGVAGGDPAPSSAAIQQHRKPFDELFFSGLWGSPIARQPSLSSSSLSPLTACLEAVRASPSSWNCQPWRVVIATGGDVQLGAVVHFFDVENTPWSGIDLGVAMADFELVARGDFGLHGTWSQKASPSVAATVNAPAHAIHVATWTLLPRPRC
jgi:hypothetical protein